MLIKQWAKEQGISYWTALRWFHAGKMPVPTIQTATGTLLVSEDKPAARSRKAALYARVSSTDQKEDLERQTARLRDFAAKLGVTVAREVSEIGSGLNGRRKGLLSLLKDPNLDIIVEHRDRLARFGVEYIEAVLEAQGRTLTVLNASENKFDLVQDFIDVVTCLCARIYGKRSARNKAKRALEASAEPS